MQAHHLQILLKCRFWLWGPRVKPEVLKFLHLPGCCWSHRPYVEARRRKEEGSRREEIIGA